MRRRDQPLGLQILGGVGLAEAGLAGVFAAIELLLPLAGASALSTDSLVADLYFVLIGGVLAYPLLTERSWAREAVMAVFVIHALAPVLAGLTDSGLSAEDALLGLALFLVAAAVVTAPLLWYLYRKASVVDYFRTLKAGRDAQRAV